MIREKLEQQSIDRCGILSQDYIQGYVDCKEELTDKILKWCRINSIAEYMGVDSWAFEGELKKAMEE